MGPYTRGFAAADALQQLDRFEPGLEARVRKFIPISSQQAIDDAAPFDWIPWEHERHTPAVIFELLGDRGTDYFRWLVSRHLVHAPMLGSFMRKVQRLFGIDPGGLLRITPLAFDMAFRGCCRFVPKSRSSHSADVHLTECAPEVFEYPAYIRSWSGAIGGVLDVANFDGEVRYEVDEALREVRYTLYW